MNMQKVVQLNIAIFSVTLTSLTGCGNANSGVAADTGRLQQFHEAVQIIDPSGNVVSTYKMSSPITARTADINTVNGVAGATSISVQLGSIYLESQLAPPTVGGYALQASDAGIYGPNAYIGYSKVDGTSVVKVGAVEQVTAVNCDNLLTLTHVEYCLNLVSTTNVPAVEIFGVASDGTNLYAVGSTLDETASPNYGRLLKYSLDSNKSPSALLATQVLPSYAGTDVDVLGAKVYVSSGTSTTTAIMGGLSAWNTADLSNAWQFNWYDARGVMVDRATPANLYAINGYTDGTHPSTVVQVDAAGGTGITRTTAITGNTIAESKSSLIVGNQLILASMGSQGFRVLCKSSGATLASVAAIDLTASGIPLNLTVTNSVAAVPGFVFAADGEAGVYVYQFTRNNILNSNLCTGGVTLTLVGRMALSLSSSSAIYANAELSANSLKAVTNYNLLNVVTSRFLIVASGNKGISLLNLSDIALLSNGVDDF